MDARAGLLLDALGGDPGSATLVRAPGRVNLIGDHTDYNAGWCLPVAIDRDCWVAARTGRGGRLRARSLDVAGQVDVDPWAGDLTAIEPPWGRFVAAAAREVAAPSTGGELVVASTVPPGSGLASSAALCVALVLALGRGDDPQEVAAAARAAEVAATGVPVGMMDQLAAVRGRAGAALLVDCGRLEVEAVPIPAAARIGVVHSGLARTLAASEYAARRRACEAAARRLGLPSLRTAAPEQVRDDPLARHVVSENQRVLAAAAALRGGDLATLGALLVESHASLRDDFAVSTAELDLLVELLLDEGALGARLTGAGFGGCVVALTGPEDDEALLARAAGRYRRRTGLDPMPFTVVASPGAGPVPTG